MTARALMLCGTGSHVGKSVLTAALCRIFKRAGMRVVPFKSQNMSNNAAVADGGEIGRAQALQAQAAGVTPTVWMNPILLKPEGEQRSQVVVHGRVAGSMDVHAYHRFKEERGRAIVRDSYRRVSADADLVLIEGAGSPAEVNLKAHDIANLFVAEVADARVILVGDIDRGGVLASLVGTMELLAPDERARIGGFLINRFRGRRDLLEPAIGFLSERTGVPTLGVIPYLEHDLPEEDGQGVRDHAAGEGGLRIGVVRLPRIANFTDFDPFRVEPDVALTYIDRPEQVAGLDLLILPGSKATLSDLAWLRARGLDGAIRAFAGAGGRIIGICGGYQMLGVHIADPEGVEGGREPAYVDGLGLLPVTTTLAAEKRCVRVAFTPHPDAGLGTETVTGYEIHMGGTEADGGVPLFTDAPHGTGIRLHNVSGGYLHGLFDGDGVRGAVLGPLRAARGLPGPPVACYREQVEASLDRLADAVEKHVDMEALRALL